MSDDKGSSLQFRRPALALPLVGALYFAAVGVPLSVTSSTGANVGVWPAAGVGLVACLLAPRAWRWGMALVIAAANALAIALFTANPPWMIAALAGIHVLEEWGGAELLERAIGRSPRLDRSRDLVLNVAIVGMGLGFIGSVLGALVYWPVVNVFRGLQLLQWWAPEAVALLLVAPAAWHARRMLVTRPAPDPRRLERLLHMAVFGGALAVLVSLPFAIGTLPIGFVSVPFLLWAAVRLGTGTTAADTVVLAIVLVVATYFGQGPFGEAQGSLFQRVMWAQGYVLVIGVAHQVLAATIDERRRGEEALRASTARMQAFFRTSPEAVFLVDQDRRLLAATPAARALMATAGQHMPDTGERLSGDHVPDAPAVEKVWDAVMAGRRVQRTWTVGGADHEVAFTPLADADGQVLGAAVLATDVSRVHEQAARAARSQRLESVGRLAGGVAHDFNNILTAILGHVSLIESELPGYHPLRADMREVIGNVQRAAGLTRQLLAYARQQVIAPTVVEVNDVVERLRTLLRHSITESIAIELRLAPSLPPVLIDRGQLEQVIVNLCVNARDAMPTGGRLTIETSREAVEPRRAAALEMRAGECVALTVTDTGQGIDPTVLPKIFEPFFSTKGPGVGTGLGLATVDGIVRQAGGAIEVSSRQGEGATFRVLLPRATAAATAEEPPAPAPVPEPSGQGETVVVCEDDAAVRAVVVRTLARRGMRVLEFDGPEAALDGLVDTVDQVDLLVTDIVMPGLSGPELAARLRDRSPALRVLYLSGYAEATVAHQGIVDEGVDLLGKPFTPDELVRRVREALGARA